MYPYLGDFPTGKTIFVPFHTFNSSGASVTLSGLAVTDIEIYKNGSITQRSSDAGYALVDTDGIDLDGVTGFHGFTIDTSNNTDSGFFAAGSDYVVVVSAVTVDSQTVNFIAASFSIENRSLTSNVTQIAGATVSTTTAQLGVNVVQISTDATAADNLELAYDGTGYAGGTILPIVNVGAISSDTTAADNLELAFDGTGYAGGSTPQQVALTASAINSVADQVWDEAMSGHVAAGSAGAAQYIINSGTATAVSGTTIQLAVGADATDDFYNNQKIHIVSGTGAGQSRFISGYVGATRTATVSSWVDAISTDSVYVITPFGAIPGATAPTAGEVADAVWDEPMAGHTTEATYGALSQAMGLQVGTAQAGGATSITIDATGVPSSSATNDAYKYQLITIRSGTGIGQTRQITAYNGTTKVATVNLAWTVNPSSDSEYVIHPSGLDAATVAAVAAGVWAATRAGNATAGSFGEYVNADAVRLSGDATAADNAEAFFDGTGYAGTNNVIPNVTTVTGNVNGNVGGSVASVTALAANSVNASALAADAVTEIQSGLATGANLATVDTVVDAIKAKTDSLTFTVAGQVDANVQAINDTAVAGDGSAGDPWAPV
jgi:hypothetical protein